MSYLIEKDWTTAAGLHAVIIIVLREESPQGITVARKAYRCGYVGVPPVNPLHGIDYNKSCDIISQAQVDSQCIGKKSPLLYLTALCGADEEGKVRRSLDLAVDVHGGLTYSGGNGTYPVISDEWWFGFDCHHAGDREIEPGPYLTCLEDSVVRTLEYVEAECERLAAQLEDLIQLKCLSSPSEPV